MNTNCVFMCIDTQLSVKEAEHKLKLEKERKRVLAGDETAQKPLEAGIHWPAAPSSSVHHRNS